MSASNDAIGQAAPPSASPAAASSAAAVIDTEAHALMARMVALTEGQLHIQMKRELEQAERDAKAQRIAEADKAEAARIAKQESSSNTLKTLKNTASKDKLSWLVSIGALDNANDRVLMTASVIEATQMFEDGQEDLIDANAVLEAAVKKTTLSKDKQEDLLKAIKIKKRPAPATVAAAAAVGRERLVCMRCNRTGHNTMECYAETVQGGGPPPGEPSMAALAKYRRTQYGGTYAGPRESYAPPAGHQFFPSAAPPPLAYAQAPASAPYAGGYGAAQGVCRKCNTFGHYERFCPMNRPAAQAPAAQQQSGAGVSCRTREITTHTNARTTNTDTSNALMVDVGRQPDRAEEKIGEHTAVDCKIMTRLMDFQPTLHVQASTPSERQEESLASMYAAKGNSSTDPADDENSEAHDQHASSDSEQTRTISSSNVPAHVHALIASLQSTGMPERDVSLKRAILQHFAGKKKRLHDHEIAGQSCGRCGKTGHTKGGCPDQTQAKNEDETAADDWVRALIERPRVRIAEVNRGLSLEEGVTRWLQRGEEANRGNPWAQSQKREDALRKQLGYHYAMGMSAVHLGWIGFGVPLNFIEEREPEVLAFHNHKSAMEEGEFVDAEHEAGVREGSFSEVRREMLLGICPLQVEKHPVTGKRRLCQDARWINGHLPNVEFRMESLNVELGDVVQPGDKLFTTDIEKAYYCVPLHPLAQPYLGWSWRGKYYMPTCLIFGLSTAPRIFTKLMRPMMAFMRSLHVRVLGMIDDYMWAAQPGEAATVREAVKVCCRRWDGD